MTGDRNLIEAISKTFGVDLDKIWDRLPYYRRPKFLFQVAFESGMFWVEVISAMTALLLVYPAFQDLGWILNVDVTRIMLVLVAVFHSVFLFMGRRNGFWVRMLGCSYACAIWAGTASILWMLGAFTCAMMAGALFIFCFLDLINLGAEE